MKGTYPDFGVIISYLGLNMLRFPCVTILQPFGIEFPKPFWPFSYVIPGHIEFTIIEISFLNRG